AEREGSQLAAGGRQRLAQLQQPACALRDRHIDELAAGQLQRLTVGALEGVAHLPRPRELVLGRRERLVDDGQLLRVDRRLTEEAQRARERRLLAQAGLVVQAGVDAVD